MNEKMEKTASIIKLFLEKDKIDINDFSLEYTPPEEAKIFISSIGYIQKILSKFDPKYISFTKDEIEKWAIIYLNIHNFFHSQYNNEVNDLAKLEILTTAPIFLSIENIINPEEQKKLNISYFCLGLSALRQNHSLEYLISEKIIFGEFFSIGGIEQAIWGIKLNQELLPKVAKNIVEKTQKNNHHLLIKKYKNFIFDFV